MKENLSAIITAAGQGKRLNPYIPKALVTIKGKPLIYWIIKKINSKVSKIFIIVSKKNIYEIKKSIKTLFPELNKKISYIIQKNPNGTAHAINLTRKLIKTKFLLTIWCDQILFSKTTLNISIQELIKKDKYIVFPTVYLSNPYLKFEIHNKKITNIIYSIYSNKKLRFGEKDCGIFLFNSKVLFQTIKNISLKKLIPKGSKENNILEIIPYYYRVFNENKISKIKIKKNFESYGINNIKELKRATKYI